MGGLLNIIRTSRWAFSVVRLVSSAAGLFTRRRCNEGKRAGISGYINGQGRLPLAQLPYGKYTMGYCGCEVIAACNAMKMLGREYPLEDAAEYFEKHGLLFNGFFGTDIGSLRRFFTREGYDAEMVFGRRLRKRGTDALLERSDAAILSFWTGLKLKNNDGYWYSLHTVAVGKVPGGVELYNLNIYSRNAERKYGSLAHMEQERGIVPAAMLVIRKNDGEERK